MNGPVRGDISTQGGEGEALGVDPADVEKSRRETREAAPMIARAAILQLLLLAILPGAASGQSSPSVVVSGVARQGPHCDTAAPNFEVAVVPNGGALTTTQIAEAKTDADGVFHLFVPSMKAGLVVRVRDSTGAVRLTAGIPQERDGIATFANPLCLGATRGLSALGVTEYYYAYKPLFFITDRAIVGNNIDPTNGSTEKLGVGTVNAWVGLKPGTSCPSWSGWACIQETFDDGDVTTSSPTSLQVIDADDQIALGETLSKALESAPQKSILLFVHGYNSTFGGALGSLAKLEMMAQPFNGLAIGFSWASVNRDFGYFADENAALTARRHLSYVIRALLRLPSQPRIYIVAHSMGNFIVSDAIHDVLLGEPSPTKNTLTSITFAAADVDDAQFRAWTVQDAAGSSPAVKMYTSSQDYALRLSQCIHGQLLRAGQDDLGWPSPLVDVDLSKTAPTTDWGHGYITSSIDLALDFYKGFSGEPTPGNMPSIPDFLHQIPWLGTGGGFDPDQWVGHEGLNAFCTLLKKIGF